MGNDEIVFMLLIVVSNKDSIGLCEKHKLSSKD